MTPARPRPCASPVTPWRRPPCGEGRPRTTSRRDRQWEAAAGLRRREVILSSGLLPLFLAVLGSDDATTVVNSVLSGYGLPTLKKSVAFRVYDEFEDNFFFEYPKGWVSRPNSMRMGVYISDYQTNDKVTVEVFEAPNGAVMDQPFVQDVITRFIAPGYRQQDDRLELPAPKTIRTESQIIDGQDYIYMSFPSNVITRSGYNVQRKNIGVAAIRKGFVYALCASARSDQATSEKQALLRDIVASFRVR